MPHTKTNLNFSARLKQLALPIAVAAITAGATNAFGGLSLIKVPLVLPADGSNECRCITFDGKYAAGLSGANNGFMYDVAKSNVVRPLAAAYASIITGIAYRTDTAQSPAQLQLILDGENNGYQGQWMTADAGTNWGKKLIENGYSQYAPPAMNSLAGKIGAPDFYWTYRSAGKDYVYTSYALALWDNDNIPGVLVYGKSVPNPPDKVYTTGISANGRMVGYRLYGDTGINVNNLWDWPPGSPTSYQWNGLSGTTNGEAWSVNQDGTVIFGRSPITLGGADLYAYKAFLTAPPTRLLNSVAALPELPRIGGSITRAVPYGCTADGKYAVGYFFPHVTLAALWDTSDGNPAKWKATDLTALAARYGAGVPDVFTSLTKAYSVGTNATDVVIAGFGVEAGTGNNRAFVMTVPKTMAAVGYANKPTLTFSGTYPAGLTLSFYGEPGTTNHLEYTTTLTLPSSIWTEIASNAIGLTGATITVTDANPVGQQRFYRVRIDP
jgi:uncharacterized membrane protein